MSSDTKRAGRLAKVGKAAVLVGACLVFVSQTSPEVAKSNISAWLHMIGIDQVPHALTSAAADHWLLIFSICEIVIGVVFWLWSRGLEHEYKETERLARQGAYVELPKVGGPLGAFITWLGARFYR